ncbi:hypothetical protein INT45_010652 [Circinella minor]|uniref:Transposase domain-containing protein n=1 Tax=Circinella minor TaxID=1195481 RepID=A0A8H7S292_9FUNG|nr:hypothetical protein INT45_010652 [Circinella minor]
MRVKTKDYFWCRQPIFTANLKQHEDNECEKNPYADPNNPVPPKKRQRRSTRNVSLPGPSVPTSISTTSFDMTHDSLALSMNEPMVNNNVSNVAESMYDYYDDDFLWENDNNMDNMDNNSNTILDVDNASVTVSSPESLSNDQLQVSTGDNDDESLSALANDMMDIDHDNEMEDNIINNNNEEGIFEAHYENQSSIIMTNNDGEPVKCSVPPIREFDEQLKRSVELYQIIQEKNITDDAYAQILKFVNDCLTSKKLAGKPILSKHMAETKITEMYPVKPVYYDYCPNGCRLYTDYISVACSCGLQRYKTTNLPNLQAVSSMLYMPLAQQLAALIASDSKREHLMTLSNRESEEPGVREDFFDGDVYKTRRSLFNGNLDIAITLFIDGFTPFRKKLRKLQKAGLEVKCSSGLFRLNVHLMLTSGDIVAVQELVYHSYRALYGCRICPIRTINAVSPEGAGNGNYFRGSRNVLPQFRDIGQFIDGAPAFSIKKKTKFAELESFHSASFFGLDEMHLIGANVSTRVWEMISGSFKNSTTSFELGTSKRQIIGSSVESSANTMPSSIFEGDFRNYYTKPGNMRSVDWICFLLFVVPTMVCDMLELQLGVEQAKAVVDALVVSLLFRSMAPHIPEIVKLLGPPRCISARSMERAIGFFKKRIKSQKNPGVNAGNILRCQQACRYYNSLLEDKEGPEEDVDDEQQPATAYSINCNYEGDDNTQLWNYFESSVDNYIDINLRHYLVKFWRRKFPNHIINYDDITDNIIVGRRLYRNETVYDAIKTKRKTDKLCHFVKMDIEVDIKKARRNAPVDLQVQTFFGEVIMYFVHEYNDILNGVDLNSAGCPCGPYTIGHTGDKRNVVEVEAIRSHAGILSMPLTTVSITDNVTHRNYYIYPKMVPKTIIVGNVGLL